LNKYFGLSLKHSQLFQVTEKKISAFITQLASEKKLKNVLHQVKMKPLEAIN